MRSAPSAHQQLADQLLGGELEELVRELRAGGASWSRIARELWATSDRKVNLTAETLRRWFGDLPKRGAA